MFNLAKTVFTLKNFTPYVFKEEVPKFYNK